MDCKIVRTVDFLIVNLWMALDGVLIATAQLLRGINLPLDQRDVYMFVIFLFFCVLQALLLFLHLLLFLLLSFLYLCARAKPILIPCPLFCVTESPSWLSTSDEKWAIYVTGCLFDFRSALPHFCFCNFL